MFTDLTSGQFVPMHHSGAPAEALSGERRDIFEPATDVLLASVPEAGPGDVEDAYRGAVIAQREWMAWSAVDRATAMHRIAHDIEVHADELALLEARDSGNPVTAMRRDVLKGAELFRF